MTLTWANLLSALRIALIPLFVVTLTRGETLSALLLFGFAGLTDLFDGIVARSYQQQSKLGAFLDPAADKLLLTCAYLMLSLPVGGLPRLIPFWVFLLVLARDLLIVICAAIIYRRIRFSRFRPLRLSKWNTAFQIIGVFLVLIADVMPAYFPTAVPVTDLLARATIMAVVVLTSASGLEYAYRFIYRYRDLEPGKS